MRYRLIWVIIWSGVILSLSLIPSSGIPEITIDLIVQPDKLAHITLYAIYTYLIGKYFKAGNQKFQRKDLMIIGISGGYGILMEFLQFFLSPSRFFDFYDIIANIIGSIVGLILLKIKI